MQAGGHREGAEGQVQMQGSRGSGPRGGCRCRGSTRNRLRGGCRCRQGGHREEAEGWVQMRGGTGRGLTARVGADVAHSSSRDHEGTQGGGQAAAVRVTASSCQGCCCRGFSLPPGAALWASSSLKVTRHDQQDHVKHLAVPNPGPLGPPPPRPVPRAAVHTGTESSPWAALHTGVEVPPGLLSTPGQSPHPGLPSTQGQRPPPRAPAPPRPHRKPPPPGSARAARAPSHL